MELQGKEIEANLGSDLGEDGARYGVDRHEPIELELDREYRAPIAQLQLDRILAKGKPSDKLVRDLQGKRYGERFVR
jgi:hypothetical protein